MTGICVYWFLVCSQQKVSLAGNDRFDEPSEFDECTVIVNRRSYIMIHDE